jgi:DNA repair protein RecN (Recombination protein N)
MLKALSIQNYAIIEKLDIEFYQGLSIVTGETGAGKSILLGALSLILGQRADSSVLNNKTRKCIVEATFDIKDYGLKNFFSANDVDYADHTLIRREISEEGKSRSFVNDTPVNLSLLKDLGAKLVDIHSQHQNLNLNDNLFQLRVVDSMAQHGSMLEDYHEKYTQYRKLFVQYNELKDKMAQTKADAEYFQFQFDQLNDARLQAEEQQELEAELEVLKHAEEIKKSLENATQLLSGENISVLIQLKEAISLTSKIKSFYQPAEELSQRLESIYVEMKDIAGEAAHQEEKIDLDPSRLIQVNERLDLFYSLFQKHRVSSVLELIDLRNDLEEKLSNISSFDDRLEAIGKETDRLKEELSMLSAKLSHSRAKVIPVIESRISELLKILAIPNAAFKVQQTLLDDFTPTGMDKVSFLFSANKQSDLQDISRVASGGELSRLMLSIKSLLSQSIGLPTIIFDEIDTGVSGDVADKVGNIIKEMSYSMQVINITHLPQIASKGKYHYFVYKTDINDASRTNIKLLTKDERVIEIAKMLSGEKVTDAAMDNARVLLNR